METTVVNHCFKVDDFVSCQNAALGCRLNTLVDRLNVFFGNTAAHGFVFKDVAAARFQRFETETTMAVLTFTAALSDVFTLAFNRFSDCLAVADLRFTYVGFNLKLAQKSVDDNFQVKLAHAGDNRLPRFGVGISFKSRVFFRKFCQCKRHFFLTLFGLGLDCDLDDGFGENHVFQHDGRVLVAQSIARSGILQTYDGDDFACVSFLNFLSLGGMHLQNFADSFPFVFDGVVNVSTRL